VASGEKTETFTAHSQSVAGIAFSADGQSLVSGSTDDAVRIWDLMSGEAREVHSTALSDNVVRLAYSPQSGCLVASSGTGYGLVTGAGAGSLHVWQFRTRKVAEDFKRLRGQGKWFRAHSAEALGLAFSADGGSVASTGLDGTVKVWDTSPWKLRRTLPGHANGLVAMDFSPHSRTLALGSADGAVYLLDPAAKEIQRELRGHTDVVSAVAYSPDGATLATGGYDRTIRLWDLAAGEVRATLEGHKRPVWSVAFSPDGKTLASGAGNVGSMGSVKLWDLETNTERRTFKGPFQPVRAVCYSPDGNTLAIAAGDGWPNVSGDVWLWNSTEEEPAKLGTHRWPILCAAFSPDGTTLATGSWDRVIKVWDVAKAKERGTLEGHGARVWGLAFSPDGSTLISAAEDKTIRLWDPGVLRGKGSFEVHQSGLVALAYSPDGKTLAVAGQHGGLVILSTTADGRDGPLAADRRVEVVVPEEIETRARGATAKARVKLESAAPDAPREDRKR
jgi:WD40 repeat protein